MQKGRKLRVLVEGPISEPIKRIYETLGLLKCIDGIETWLVSSVEGELRGVYPDLSLFSVPWSAMPSIYKSCHCLIKNSKTEGFPLPVMEMMASGGVPIVNKLGYEEGLIENRLDGIILNEITPDGLTESLAFIGANYEQMSRRAQEKIRRYSWGDHASRLEKIIESAVAASSPKNKTMKIFTTPNPESAAERWVWQGAKPSRSASYNRNNLLVGWIAQQDGGDIYSARLSNGDNVIDITPNHHRPDVETFFGKSGIYGFEYFLSSFDQQDNWSIEYKISQDSKSESLPIKLIPGQYDSRNARVYIESSIEDARTVIDFGKTPNLKEVFIKFKQPSQVWINGDSHFIVSLFETSGVIMFEADACHFAIERYRSV
ncbi:Glycosyltransferase Family 4 protein [Glomus cerebriforme]|uniref:Glycosyltransferase Family 4 protein n=1 Tax=Glomus cerebriforme TaxID=658196 RepID=A0A397S8B2_9GLOM|nr:Glycosyltransferase Family 4 protein [Glomus cerebriforme]